MSLLTIVLAAFTSGKAAIIAAQLAALVALVVSISSMIFGIFKVPEGTWNGWLRRIITWVISIGLVFLCYFVGPLGEWLPSIPVLLEPWWLSCILEGILLGGLANGVWTQDWVQKICEFIENLFNKKKD